MILVYVGRNSPLWEDMFGQCCFFVFFLCPGLFLKMVGDLFYSTLFLIIFFFVVFFFCTPGQTSFGLPRVMDVTCIWSCVLV